MNNETLETEIDLGEWTWDSGFCEAEFKSKMTLKEALLFGWTCEEHDPYHESANAMLEKGMPAQQVFKVIKKIINCAND